MKKSDLKTGMIVTIRLGERYVVMKDTLLEGDDKDVLINLRIPGSWMPLNSYNEDLTAIDKEDDDIFVGANTLYKVVGANTLYKDFDIIRVEAPLNPAGINSVISPFVKTIWTRGD